MGPLLDRFMRDDCSLVRIHLVDVTHRRHIGTVSDVRGLELIGDHPPGFTALTFDQETKKAFSRKLIPPGSYEDINGIAFLVYGGPQILPFPLDGHKHFVDMPSIPQPPLLFLELACVGRPKLLTLQTNSFINHCDFTFS